VGTIKDLLNKLEKNANPSKTAIIYEGVNIPYSLFLKEINRVADGLKKLECRKDDVVGILLPDSPFLIYSMLAIGKIGGIFIGLNIKYPESEIQYLIQQSKTKVVITNKLLIHNLKLVKDYVRILMIEELNGYPLRVQSEKVNGDDKVAIILTSGTTGVAKGVYHTHSNLVRVGENCVTAWEIGEEDRLLSGIPLLSAASLSAAVMPSLVKGACLVIPPDRKPHSILQSIDKDKVSFILGTPTTFVQMLNFLNEYKGCFNLSSLKRGTVAGAPIPEGLIKQVKERMGCKLYPHYGMTELLAISAVLPGGDGESLGKPLSGISIKIVDQEGAELCDGEVGEIVCNSPTKGKGYLGESSSLLEGNWFHTGDLGIINGQGNLKIVGRLKNMIIRGGNNIYPEEIEKVLASHENVLKGGVIGVPDDIYGEQVIAFVVPKEKKVLTELEIKDFMEKRLPVFKRPQQIIFVSEIPTSESGKIYRQKLEKMYDEEICGH